MKRIVGSFFMLICLYLLQTTVFSRIAIAGVKPNVIIILTVAAGYKYGKIPGIMMGFFTGLFIDMSEGSYLGYYALMYLVIGYLAGFCNKIYNNDSNIIPLLLTGGLDFLLNLMQYVTGFLLRNKLDLPYYLIRIILPEFVYTLVSAALLYKIIDFCYTGLEAKKKETKEEEA